MLKIIKYELIEKLLFISFFSGIVYILIFNIFHYDQIFGYDAEAHTLYVDNFLNMFVPGKTNQPSSNFTYEFFSPPLPYIFPTFVNELCKFYFSGDNLYQDCRLLHSFLNMIFQSFLFIFTIFIYIKIVNIYVKKKNILNNVAVLLVLGLFTANYRTIAMLRGETFIIFLNSFLLYRFLILYKKSFDYNKKDIFLIGVTIGLLALSRQWAFLLFPAYFFVYLFKNEASIKKKYLKLLFFVFSIGFAISSWFYFSLYFEYGTFTAFNKEKIPFSFNNQPLSFYLPFGEEVSMVFTKPIRPYFMNQFLPILFADLWGDYWGYFTFTSRALDIGRNQLLIGDYLARVNIISVFPTILLFLGFKYNLKFFKKRKKEKSDFFICYLVLAVTVSFFGYLWFLISYPETTGDTNKATYIIHMFHLLGLLAVLYLENLKKENQKIYIFWIFILSVTFIHNFSAMMSHFPFQDELINTFFYY